MILFVITCQVTNTAMSDKTEKKVLTVVKKPCGETRRFS